MDKRNPARVDSTPDKKLAAVCGLFCPGCTIYIATRETPERREQIAQLLRRPVETLVCDGCRSERRYTYCQTCKMFACAAERGVDFCGACADYPCEELRTFQAARPHRLELWQAQARIQEAGYEVWFEEMFAHYACPECGTLNSAYLLSCRECGATPSCGYVAAPRAEIVDHPSERAAR